MRYIHKTLLDNEQIVYMTHPHWIGFAPSVCTLILSLAVWMAGPYYLALSVSIHGISLSEIFAIFFGAYGGYQFIKHYIFYHFSEYGVTNKRVLMKTGWLERNSLEIFLDKIEAVHVDQSIWGRILGFGSVIIIGTGGSKDPFRNVPQPLHFRKMVQQEIDYVEQKLYRI